MDIYIDDFNVECSYMEFTSDPNISELKYVLDMAFCFSYFYSDRNRLPMASGNITILTLEILSFQSIMDQLENN
jgi:hypothetical protein